MPEVNKSLANLKTICEETLVLYREAHKNIQFTITEETELPSFNFDPEQIKRCIINLLDNGVAVLPEGGKIEINLAQSLDKKSAFLQIKDNGPGINSAHKTRLFEPYFSTKKSGTGLGLAIVSTIVSDHGGYIRVQNNYPKGSVFTIELPMSEAG